MMEIIKIERGLKESINYFLLRVKRKKRAKIIYKTIMRREIIDKGTKVEKKF